MEKYLIGASFEDNKLRYATFEREVAIDSPIVVDVQGSFFLGTVTNIRPLTPNEDISIYDKVLREATVTDVNNYKSNLDRELKALKLIQKEVKKSNLKMSVFRVSYTLDLSKLVILYTADDRVDFRELLRTLSSMLHTRIEMRQVGPRDRARLIGGIGPCGLKLCCSSFLSSFEGISINMAKNQMLTLNIPKLSGQCGKLMCCLKYEDHAYTEMKKSFPPLGEKLRYENNDVQVTGVNVLNNTITIGNKEVRYVLTRSEYRKAKDDKKNGSRKK